MLADLETDSKRSMSLQHITQAGAAAELTFSCHGTEHGVVEYVASTPRGTQGQSRGSQLPGIKTALH